LSASVVKIGVTLKISGQGFDPTRPAVAAIYQNAKAHVLSGPVDVGIDGTFVVTVRIPAGLSPGAAEIVACSYNGSPVRPPPSECGVKAVVVKR
jgi:hypothetical protein